PIKVDKAQYPIQASFQPGEAGVTYRAWYAQESLGKKIASRVIKSDKNDDLSAMLTLEPGVNVIQIGAVNERAVGRPHEDEEAAAASIRVLYEPRKVPPPSIAFTHLVPENSVTAVKILERTVRYQSAKGSVGVRYAIKSEDPIATLEYEVAPGRKRQPLAMPSNDKAETVRISLTPGKQTLRVFLKTTTGIGAE